MNEQQAKTAVTVSAVVVAIVYAYRRLTEGAAPGNIKNIVGSESPPVPLGQFVTAWGVVFLVLSLMTEAAPAFGGAFAILVATGDLLTNTASLAQDVGKQEGGSGKASSAITGPGATTGTAPGLPSASAVNAATLASPAPLGTNAGGGMLTGSNPSLDTLLTQG